MREVNSQPVRGLILQDLNEHETSHVLQFGVLNESHKIKGNVSHNKLNTNIAAFSVPLVSVLVEKVGVGTQQTPDSSNSPANTYWSKYGMLSEPER